MTAATAIRATALPMPAVTVTEKVSAWGTVAKGLTGVEVQIGSETYTLASDGRVYAACYRCSGRGFMSEYAGIYAGECFSCRYRGVRLVGESTEAVARKVRSAQAAAMREAAKYAAEAPAREAAARAAMEAAHEAAIAEDARRSEAAAAKAAVVAAARYVGAKGEKVTVTGVVKVNMSVEGFRPGSSSRFVIVEGTGADAGVTIKTVGTSDWHYDVERGETVTMTATVKRHSEYNGVAQTEVIRPKAA